MDIFYTYLIMKLDDVRIACGIAALVLSIVATVLYMMTDIKVNLKDVRFVLALVVLTAIVLLLPSTEEMRYLLSGTP